jgi:hypothetical protein
MPLFHPTRLLLQFVVTAACLSPAEASFFHPEIAGTCQATGTCTEPSSGAHINGFGFGNAPNNTCASATQNLQAYCSNSGFPSLSGTSCFGDCTGTAGGGGGGGGGGSAGGGSSGPALPTPLIPFEPTGYRGPGVQRLGGGMFDFGATNPMGSFQGEAGFTSHYTSSFADWAEEAEDRSKKSDEAAVKELMETYGADYSAFNKMCAEYRQTCSLVCSAIDCSEGDPRTNLKFLSTEGVLPSPYGNPAGIFNAAGDPVPPPNTTSAYEYKFLGRSLSASGAMTHLHGTTTESQKDSSLGKASDAGSKGTGVSGESTGVTLGSPGAKTTPPGSPNAFMSPLTIAESATPAEAASGGKMLAHGVTILGSPPFLRSTSGALDRIDKLPTGKKLLTDLAATGKTVVIQEWSEDNGECTADSFPDAGRLPSGAPGKGTGSTVDFKPSFKPDGTPNEYVLAHELIHAYHNATGTQESGTTPTGEDSEEAAAIGLPPFPATGLVENQLLVEGKHTPRKTHATTP